MKAAPITPRGEVILYEAPDGQVRVDVRFDHDTVWLTQEQMGQLFGRERSVITKHVRNVFREGELEPEATCVKFAQVQSEGERTVTREINHYNLDVIISVGYRVKSSQGTRFRQWAILEGRLRQALVRLNPQLPPEALEDAFRKLKRADAPSLVERNRAIHRMLVDGVTVEYPQQAASRGAGAQIPRAE